MPNLRRFGESPMPLVQGNRIVIKTLPYPIVSSQFSDSEICDIDDPLCIDFDDDDDDDDYESIFEDDPDEEDFEDDDEFSFEDDDEEDDDEFDDDDDQY